jgi:hypothetical protein
MRKNKIKRTVRQIHEEQKEKNRCYVCHKKFPKQTTTAYLKLDETYQGNMIVVKETSNLASKTLLLWDGESYNNYDAPFCGKSCATKYAKVVIKKRGKSIRENLELVDLFSDNYRLVAENGN